MAFKSLRNHIGSLITPFIADAISGKTDAKSAGKVALRKYLDEIKTTDTKLNGRINLDTILLKVSG